jgi:hypothetical protein
VVFNDVINNNSLIPRFAFNLFQKELKGVYGISGIIKYFVQQAAHGARVFATPGIYKDITLLDINSLYPSVLANMDIPTGTPVVWNEKTDLTKCNYYILGLNITETTPCELYPYAKTIYRVMDKYDIEDQIKYCNMKYEIIRGYVWNSGSINVKDFMTKIYNKKKTATGDMKKLYKNMFNTIFGKTLQKATKREVYKRFDTDEDFCASIERYRNRIKQIDYVKRELILNKPYDTSFNFGFIGCAILSLAKRKINDIFELCTNNNIHILYHNNDSLLIHTRDVKYFNNMISDDIGHFHVDAQGTEAIIPWFHDKAPEFRSRDTAIEICDYPCPER